VSGALCVRHNAPPCKQHGDMSCFQVVKTLNSHQTSLHNKWGDLECKVYTVHASTNKCV